MKKYEDMAREVLHRINEYEAEKEMKRAKVTKVVASVTPVCAAAVVGVGLWKLSVPDKPNNHIIGKIDDTSIIFTDNISTEKSSTTVRNNTTGTNKPVSTTTTGIPVITIDNTKENTYEKDVVSADETDTDDITHTEITAVPTESIVTTKQPTVTNATHTEEQTFVTTTEPNGGSNGGNGNVFGGDALGSVIIDGIYYLQSFSDQTVYTPEEYLGNGGDFKGCYQGDTSISFYKAKENEDIVIVMFYDGSQLNLLKKD